MRLLKAVANVLISSQSFVTSGAVDPECGKTLGDLLFFVIKNAAI
jgi:hypothetical protein